VPDPESGNVRVLVKRRRTHRHRRNRLIRRYLAFLLITFCTGITSTFLLSYFSPSIFFAQRVRRSAIDQAELRRGQTELLNQVLSPPQSSRPVYPYSVVAGGVEDAKELKWIAEHDPVVAAHYAGFDYARARVVRLTLARTVYLSYRIGNKIYWTSHRVTLHKGEKVITDGRLTARARCANRVEETPQQQSASAVEPPLEKFDEPVMAGNGTAMQNPPLLFASALIPRPPSAGPEPPGPLAMYDPFIGGSFIPFSPPPLPEGVCQPLKKKGSTAPVETGGKKKKPGPCGSEGGETVPEPGTWILFASGLALIAWQARRRLAHP
jgi:hypothetical protein